MPEPADNLFSLVFLGLATGSLVTWIWAIRQWASGRTLLPFETRRRVPWGLVDLFVILAVWFAVLIVVVLLVGAVCGILPGSGQIEVNGGDEPDGAELAALLMASAISSVLTLAVALAWLVIRAGAKRSDLGIDWGKAVTDARLGLFAFVMLIGPVFAIQYALVLLLQPEQEHPVVTMLKSESGLMYLAVAGFMAVIVAPIAEEYFFRVILQGWLENVAYWLRGVSRRRSEPVSSLAENGKPEDLPGLATPDQAVQLMLGGAPPPTPREPIAAEGDAVVEAEVVDAGPTDEMPSQNPYVSPQVTPAFASAVPAAGETGADDAGMRPALWPIVVTSAVFALMHLGNGPDPIPLFVLAIGLGYLYQRTHRVLPCIVVHMLLNATSLTLLWLAVTFGIE